MTLLGHQTYLLKSYEKSLISLDSCLPMTKRLTSTHEVFQMKLEVSLQGHYKRLSVLREVKFPRPLEIVPCKLLNSRESYSRQLILEIHSGIVELNWLSDKSRYLRDDKFSGPLGIGPWNLLQEGFEWEENYGECGCNNFSYNTFFSVIMSFALKFRVFHVNFVLCNKRYSPFNFLNYFLLDILLVEILEGNR